MFRKFTTPLLAASALALIATPAFAGKEDRARAAIAAAEAKIQTAESMGASTEMPRQSADARAALAMAREHFRADRDSRAISAAIQASSLADAEIGELQHRKDMAVANAQDARAQDVAVAQQQASDAQQQAAQANVRADMAQQQAANSAADASAARNAALLAAQSKPSEVETTVTTTQPAARSAARTTTRQPVRKTTTTRRTVTATPTTTTTTTVRAAVN